MRGLRDLWGRKVDPVRATHFAWGTRKIHHLKTSSLDIWIIESVVKCIVDVVFLIARFYGGNKELKGAAHTKYSHVDRDKSGSGAAADSGIPVEPEKSALTLSGTAQTEKTLITWKLAP
jgi:hypothetical protein